MARRVGGRAAVVALVWSMAAVGGPAVAQTVPEVVRPRSDSPTLPPGTTDGDGPRPRSENPLADGARPIPDGGVVAPPGLGSTPVIKPTVTGTMPVIPPPGAPGGDRSVVPK